MEGWELRRRDASIGGTPIGFLSADREVGRRIETHVFRNRALPWTEEAGRLPRSFTVRCVVGGPDHDLDAERLERLLESQGPHELVLPSRSPILVSTGRCRFSEPEGQARVQFVSIPCVEAGLQVQPRLRLNTAGIVQTAVSNAWAEISNRFGIDFSLVDQSSAAIDRIAEVATGAVTAVNDAFEIMRAGATITEELAAYAQGLQDLEQTIAAQIVSAATAAQAFQDSLDQALELPLEPLTVFSELAAVVRYGSDFPNLDSNSISRSTFVRNQDALVGMVSRSATAARAKALSLATFESSSQAAALRQEIATELDAAILGASNAFSDEEARLLRKLKADTIRDLDERGARLPRLVTYTPTAPVPSLVLAQRLYGSPDRELELVARNIDLIENPGAIPFGTPLEVLRSV